MRRVTVCILEGEPQLPKGVMVITGISGTWNEEMLGENLALAFNFLRGKLEKKYRRKIPLVLIIDGQKVTITKKVWKQLVGVSK